MGEVMKSGIDATASTGNTLLSGYQQEKIADENAKRQLQLANLSKEEQARQFNILQNNEQQKRQSYQQALKGATGMTSEAESKFYDETNTALPELAQMRSDIQSGNAESMREAANQMQSNIAKQGMRGGQAATQLRRGIGEMGIQGQRDINKISFEDAQRRAALRQSYAQSKGLLGTAFQYNPQSAQNY